MNSFLVVIIACLCAASIAESHTRTAKHHCGADDCREPVRDHSLMQREVRGFKDEFSSSSHILNARLQDRGEAGSDLDKLVVRKKHKSDHGDSTGTTSETESDTSKGACVKLNWAPSHNGEVGKIIGKKDQFLNIFFADQKTDWVPKEYVSSHDCPEVKVGDCVKVSWVSGRHKERGIVLQMQEYNGENVSEVKFQDNETEWIPMKALNYSFETCPAIATAHEKSSGVNHSNGSQGNSSARNQSEGHTNDSNGNHSNSSANKRNHSHNDSDGNKSNSSAHNHSGHKNNSNGNHSNSSGNSSGGNHSNSSAHRRNSSSNSSGGNHSNSSAHKHNQSHKNKSTGNHSNSSAHTHNQSHKNKSSGNHSNSSVHKHNQSINDSDGNHSNSSAHKHNHSKGHSNHSSGNHSNSSTHKHHKSHHHSNHSKGNSSNSTTHEPKNSQSHNRSNGSSSNSTGHKHNKSHSHRNHSNGTKSNSTTHEHNDSSSHHNHSNGSSSNSTGHKHNNSHSHHIPPAPPLPPPPPHKHNSSNSHHSNSRRRSHHNHSNGSSSNSSAHEQNHSKSHSLMQREVRGLEDELRSRSQTVDTRELQEDQGDVAAADLDKLLKKKSLFSTSKSHHHKKHHSSKKKSHKPDPAFAEGACVVLKWATHNGDIAKIIGKNGDKFLNVFLKDQKTEWIPKEYATPSACPAIKKHNCVNVTWVSEHQGELGKVLQTKEYLGDKVCEVKFADEKTEWIPMMALNYSFRKCPAISIPAENKSSNDGKKDSDGNGTSKGNSSTDSAANSSSS